MLVKEMVQYTRTADMEELYLMLNNDSVAYNLWHDYAEKVCPEDGKWRGGNDGECRPCDDCKNHPILR